MAETLRAATYLDKGGTGKTTCTAHIGVALHELGESVLLIDLAGKQGDLAKVFGCYQDIRDDIATEDDYPNIATTMRDRWPEIADMLGAEKAVAQLVYETAEGPDLILAHPDLDSLNADLGNVDDVHDRYTRLRGFLDEYIDPLDYSVVLLDLPGKGDNVAYNGLWATQQVWAPVKMGPFELDQAKQLRDELAMISEPDAYDEPMTLTMLLPNLYDRTTNLDGDRLTDFRAEFDGLIADDWIVKSQGIENATDVGQTIFAAPEDELSTTARDAKEAFLTVADDLRTQLQA
jgi:chromosome partitioning protein